MTLVELIYIFVWDDFNVLLSLLAGIILVGHKLPRRRYLGLRIAVCILVAILWFLLADWLRIQNPAPGMAYLLCSISKYLVLYALGVACVLLCLHCNIFTAIFCVTIAYCLEHISQRILGIVRLYVTDFPIWLDRTLLFFVSLFVFSVLYWVLIRSFVCYGDDVMADNKLMILLALSVICTDIIVNTIAMGESFRLGSKKLSTCIFIFSIISSLMALIISMCQTRAANASRESATVKQILYNERNQYLRDKSTIDVINIKCHDLKHQLAAFENRMDRAELSELQKMVDVYDSTVQTENAALNVVLSSKSLLCLSKKIALTCIADGRQLSFMSDADIYSLFSNILDNAIEAADQLADADKRIICLTVTARKAFLFIHQENYYEGVLRFADELPQTTKENRQYHGFGMRSIRALTQKYGGDMQIDASGNIYILDVMLPVAETLDEG